MIRPTTPAHVPTSAAVKAPAPAIAAPQALRPLQRQVQAAYLAHELRAPVTSIRLGLESVAESAADRLLDDEKKMLEIAIRNTVRLESLVNDIMDYSKLAAGRMTVTKTPCDARGLLDEAVDTMRASAVAKGVRIIKDTPAGLPRCDAESRRVVQVLINLISNAVKFAPARGTVTVGVTEGTREHEGALLFRVKDTGPGLDAADLERVFGMFEQAGGSVKTTSGTGLGLALARAMVELHGGRIWAESWKGCGATFCFTIPIAATDLSRPVELYAEPLQFHGLVAEFGRRFNAVLALFI